MDREDVFRMAREVADIQTDSRGREEFIFDSYGIEAFANLVAAAERERIIAANAPEIEKVNVYIKALEDAVAAEREACAYLCDRVAEENRYVDEQAELCAFAIRERGAP